LETSPSVWARRCDEASAEQKEKREIARRTRPLARPSKAERGSIDVSTSYLI